MSSSLSSKFQINGNKKSKTQENPYLRAGDGLRMEKERTDETAVDPCTTRGVNCAGPHTHADFFQEKQPALPTRGFRTHGHNTRLVENSVSALPTAVSQLQRKRVPAFPAAVSQLWMQTVFSRSQPQFPNCGFPARRKELFSTGR